MPLVPLTALTCSLDAAIPRAPQSAVPLLAPRSFIPLLAPLCFIHSYFSSLHFVRSFIPLFAPLCSFIHHILQRRVWLTHLHRIACLARVATSSCLTSTLFWCMMRAQRSTLCASVWTASCASPVQKRSGKRERCSFFPVRLIHTLSRPRHNATDQPCAFRLPCIASCLLLSQSSTSSAPLRDVPSSRPF